MELARGGYAMVKIAQKLIPRKKRSRIDFPKKIERNATEEKKPKPRRMEGERVKIGVSIRTDLWRKLRAMAITEGKLTGDLLDTAIEHYLNGDQNE